MSRDCPEPRKGGGGGGGGGGDRGLIINRLKRTKIKYSVCYRCNQPGHISRDCTEQGGGGRGGGGGGGS